jgi:hypothetical protein
MTQHAYGTPIYGRIPQTSAHAQAVIDTAITTESFALAVRPHLPGGQIQFPAEAAAIQR